MRTGTVIMIQQKLTYIQAQKVKQGGGGSKAGPKKTR